MEIRKVLMLRGPNIWANFPVIEAWVDLGEWKDRSSDSIPGFNQRLMSWLPTLVEHRCSAGKRGGFFERLKRGTYMAHILEHVVLELETLAGVEVGFGRARETSDEGVYKVVFRYREEKLGRACLTAARDLIMAAAEDQPFDVARTIASLKETAGQNLLGPSTQSIVDAAINRNIPYRRLDDQSLIQLGYGAKLRRIRAAETDHTGAVAESIAQDKNLTRTLLQAAGVPVAQGYAVASVEDAWETAEYIGVPVVVKPRDGNQGRGVATNLTTKEQVEAAYAAALQESSSVIVEKFVAGNDYRLLVVNGKLVAASRREPAQVMGDGRHTVAELVAIENRDPRRAEHHSGILSTIHIDDVAANVLKDQGLTADSIPLAGQLVLIRRNANLSTGGTAIDVTELVHPEVAARAIDAAKIVGLDIAGIDVIAADITKPLEAQSGIVVEVNAAPGLRMHLAPSTGEPRPVGEAIVDMMFEHGNDGRIPIAAVTGTNGKTTVTRFLAHVVRGTGKTVGMTCTDGIYINDRRVDSDDCSGPASAGCVLMNPNVEAAVFETARGGILRAGLGFDECDVAVITNVGVGDHLGLNYINTVEELAKVKRVIVDVVGENGTAVLNANDPHVVAMAPYCQGHVLFFALDGDNPVIRRHRAEGGRAVFVKGKTIYLAQGAHEEPVLNVDRIPMTFNGRISFEVENAIAVIGAAWAMGIPIETIIRQACCFATDESKVPGRFNVMKVWGATVVVDYGHNADSLRAMVQALQTFPHKKCSALYSMAGDRRDADLVNIGEMLGNAFDRVILYEDHCTRGRAPGRIAELMREGLARGKRVKEVESIQGAIPSMEYALNTVEPDELLLLQADTIDESVNFVRDYVQRAGATPVAPPKAHSWNLSLVRASISAAARRPLVHQEARRVIARPEMCFGMQSGAPRGAKAW